ncbi:MAG: hypothetical protein PHU36_03185 [Syntrophomonadaceae bacterium]|nr:hypothetical protein [Syntrophomonadaceae bacterium]
MDDDEYKITYGYNANFMELISKAWYQKETDPSPVIESYYYDGNAIDSRLSEVTDTLGHDTDYDYLYTDGKVSKITETKNIENGKQSRVETIYTSTTGYAYPEQVITYVDNQPLTSYTSYNMLLGNPSSTTDAEGRVTTYIPNKGTVLLFGKIRTGMIGKIERKLI